MESTLQCSKLGSIQVDGNISDFTLTAGDTIVVRTKSVKYPMVEYDSNGNESPLPIYDPCLSGDGTIAVDVNRHSYLATCGNRLLIIDRNQYKVEDVEIGMCPRGRLRGVDHLVDEDLYAISDASSGHIHIVDAGSRQVILQFGGKRKGVQHLQQPANLCWWQVPGSRPRLVVSDWASHCLKLFDCKGHYVESISGVKGNTFLYPGGVCADPVYGLFVCDTIRQQVVRCWYDNDILQTEVCLSATQLGKAFIPWQVKSKNNIDSVELAVTGTDNSLQSFSLTYNT